MKSFARASESSPAPRMMRRQRRKPRRKAGAFVLRARNRVPLRRLRKRRERLRLRCGAHLGFIELVLQWRQAYVHLIDPSLERVQRVRGIVQHYRCRVGGRLLTAVILPYPTCCVKYGTRPMVSKDKGNQKQVTTYYPPVDIEQLKRLSDTTRVPQAVYLREALEDLLKKYAGTLRRAPK